MGVKDYLRGLAGRPDRRVHYECGECGRNLGGDRDSCPGCGGRVAVYEL